MITTDTVSAINLNKQADKLRKDLLSPWKFYLAMLSRLPSVIYWGVKVKKLDIDGSAVTIPYKRRTKNPFKSIYFAALAGAAELSTGMICLLAIAGKGRWSTLVVDFRAEYYKKADSLISFECTQGKEVFELVSRLEGTDASETIEMVSTGYNQNREMVAKMFITWSFKQKK